MDIKKFISNICLCVVITTCLGVIFSVVAVATYEEVVDSKINRLQEERAKLDEAKKAYEKEMWKLMQIRADLWKDVWEKPEIKEITRLLDERDAQNAKEEEESQEKETAAESNEGTKKEVREEVPEEVRPDGGKMVNIPDIFVSPRWNIVDAALKKDGVKL